VDDKKFLIVSEKGSWWIIPKPVKL